MTTDVHWSVSIRASCCPCAPVQVVLYVEGACDCLRKFSRFFVGRICVAHLGILHVSLACFCEKLTDTVQRTPWCISSLHLLRNSAFFFSGSSKETKVRGNICTECTVAYHFVVLVEAYFSICMRLDVIIGATIAINRLSQSFTDGVKNCIDDFVKKSLQLPLIYFIRVTCT